MRILVFSDTHGYIDRCISETERIGDVDMILHAGDTSADAVDLASIFPSIPVHYVCGNCEISRASTELELDIDGKRLFLTHGHYYNVKYETSYSSIIKRTEGKFDVAVFGHTHKPLCEKLGELILLNPGSVRYTSTYGVIETEGDKIRASVLEFQ